MVCYPWSPGTGKMPRTHTEVPGLVRKLRKGGTGSQRLYCGSLGRLEQGGVCKVSPRLVCIPSVGSETQSVVSKSWGRQIKNTNQTAHKEGGQMWVLDLIDWLISKNCTNWKDYYLSELPNPPKLPVAVLRGDRKDPDVTAAEYRKNWVLLHISINSTTTVL